MNRTTSYCRVKLPTSKPSLNEFVQRRPKLQQLDALRVVLLYQEHLIDNYGEIAVDQKSLDIWDL